MTFVLCAAVLAVGGVTLSEHRTARGVVRGDSPGTVVAAQATVVSQISGQAVTPALAPYQNNTPGRFQVYAADLGISWAAGPDTVMIAFGDTYGKNWRPSAKGGPDGWDDDNADWRCNTLAVSSDHDLAGGLTIDSMIQDSPGHAGQILPCKQGSGEETVIPTSGVHLGSIDYLASMSVDYWDTVSGVWRTNYSQISYSVDGGRTWTTSPLRFSNNTAGTDDFQMLDLVDHGSYVYVFATPNGRFGNAYLARVTPNRLLDASYYQYWTKDGWKTGDQSAAAPVVKAPVGELSVYYDQSLGLWLMSYLDQPRDAIVLRTATSPTGPWSAEQVLVPGSKYPDLYGGFIHPWSSGNDLYFTMSLWDQYQVLLMHSTLTRG